MITYTDRSGRTVVKLPSGTTYLVRGTYLERVQ